MQEYRDDEIVSSEPLPDDAKTLLDRLAKSTDDLRMGKIDHIRIGRIPEVGELIKVNGLAFVVTVSDEKKGNFLADLVKPKSGE